MHPPLPKPQLTHDEIQAYRLVLISLYRGSNEPSERALYLIELEACRQALGSDSLELEVPERAPKSDTTYKVTNVAPERVRTPTSVRAVPRTPTVLGITVPPSSKGPLW